MQGTAVITKTVSEEAMKKAEGVILPKVKNFLAKLEDMSRRELKLEYMQVTGMEPNPRITKAWLVVALARMFQDKCWNEQIGQIPRAIAIGNSRFWLSNSVMMLDASSLKEEKKMERGLPSSERVSVLRYVDAESLWVKPIPDFQMPWNVNNTTEARFARFFEHLRRKKHMSFEDVNKWCSGQPGAIKLKPSLLYLEMERRGAVSFLMQDGSGELLDVRKRVSVESVDEELEAMPQTAYRDSINSGRAKSLPVNPRTGLGRSRTIGQQTNSAKWPQTSLSQAKAQV